MPATGDLDRDRLRRLRGSERERFVRDRPRTAALLTRARAHMPNGTPMRWMASDNDHPVYVADGAAVPSSPQVNPQVTIMALAVRLGRALAGARDGAFARIPA